MFKNFVLLGLIAGALVACDQLPAFFAGNEEEAESPKLNAAESFASENNIAPGVELISLDSLVPLFKMFCVKEEDPGPLGFVQNQVTGTWYSPKYNLAVNNTRPDICQMVFGSGRDLETVSAAFIEGSIAGFLGVTEGKATYNGVPMYLVTREK